MAKPTAGDALDGKTEHAKKTPTQSVRFEMRVGRPHRGVPCQGKEKTTGGGWGGGHDSTITAGAFDAVPLSDGRSHNLFDRLSCQTVSTSEPMPARRRRNLKNQSPRVPLWNRRRSNRCEKLTWHTNEPFGDSSAISRRGIWPRSTRREVTVARSGDGGERAVFCRGV